MWVHTVFLCQLSNARRFSQNLTRVPAYRGKGVKAVAPVREHIYNTVSYSASVVQESDYFAAPGADCDLPVSGTGKVTLYLGAKRKNRL